ncbi:MAG TPA: signal recognition particle-docking protein FtsY [Firmicutes bacterium]|nr:signal recognition particle-docking protein FtsY [Bacillota bacterium]
MGRLKEGLNKTKMGLVRRVESLLSASPALDEDFFTELEEVLIGADVGAETSIKIVDEMREAVKRGEVRSSEDIMKKLREQIEEALTAEGIALRQKEGLPTIILVVGVNGVGKTTTIAKLAHIIQGEGKRVLLAAADTFRAAAIDQLRIWSQRLNVDVVSHQPGSDPAAVVFDALQALRARSLDVLIVDTAGRLHTKANLMAELQKIQRIIKREYPEAPLEVLLVLDATTGQNALAQARVFQEAVDLTGIVLTKLDGTAKGGIIIPISRELKVPVKYIGLGEGLTDLQKFSAPAFVAALFEQKDA